MYRSERKTAPRVRDGRVQKKNRWERTEDPDDKLLSRLGITFETRSPGPGQRHVVTEIDVQRFVRCIPDWEAHAAGLRAIVLDDREDCLGEYDPRGFIYLSSWEEDLFWLCERDFFEAHEPTLRRLGVPSDPRPTGHVPLYFDESSARAFQLVHIFLHELGHHRDRMRSLDSKRTGGRQRSPSPAARTSPSPGRSTWKSSSGLATRSSSACPAGSASHRRRASGGTPPSPPENERAPSRRPSNRRNTWQIWRDRTPGNGGCLLVATSTSTACPSSARLGSRGPTRAAHLLARGRAPRRPLKQRRAPLPWTLPVRPW